MSDGNLLRLINVLSVVQDPTKSSEDTLNLLQDSLTCKEIKLIVANGIVKLFKNSYGLKIVDDIYKSIWNSITTKQSENNTNICKYIDPSVYLHQIKIIQLI